MGDDWTSGTQVGLTSERLTALAAGRIPAIIVPQFLDASTSSDIIALYEQLSPGYYRSVVPRIQKYGPAVYEHRFEERSQYFAEARDAEAMLARLESPLVRFQNLLSRECALSSRLAHDDRFGNYFAGTFRSIEEGTPVHIDFAPHEAVSWEMISHVDVQLAANVYLDMPGELIIFQKRWQLEDERYRLIDRFGYQDAAVASARSETISPLQNSLVLFNSRFFHRVAATRQRRLTYSFFVGMHNDEVILWS